MYFVPENLGMIVLIAIGLLIILGFIAWKAWPYIRDFALK